MARIPRGLLVDEGSTNHCTWRSHGYTPVLDSDEARIYYRGLLLRHKEKYGIDILSYCIMGTHPHVVSRSSLGQRAFSTFWKVVNWKFARWSNARTKGRGQVVMERLRSPRIQDGRHQLEVMRYGDMNPVRAGIVEAPSHWQWSSFRHYAYGEPDDLVTDAPEYLALGRNGPERRAAYLHLFARPLVETVQIRRADLVYGPFIGDKAWVTLRLQHAGLSPPD